MRVAVSNETSSSADKAFKNQGIEPQSSIDTVSTSIGNSEDSINDSDWREHRFECRSCGFVYDPREGIKKFSINVGTAFLDLDPVTFRCPVCRGTVDGFVDIGTPAKPSGFQENLNYGFGVNNLTPGQKNVLIFGGLAFVLACFLSLYSLH